MIDAVSFLVFILLAVGLAHAVLPNDYRSRLVWIVAPGALLLFVIHPLALGFACVCYVLSLGIYSLGRATDSSGFKARIPYSILLLLLVPDLARLAVESPILWLGSAFFIVRQMMTVAEGLKKSVTPLQFVPALMMSTFFFAALPSGPVFNGVETWNRLKENTAPEYGEGLYRLFEGFIFLFAVAGFISMSQDGLVTSEAYLSGPVGFAGILALRLIAHPVAGFGFLFATFYGYSRMAEGSALLLGFEVPQNFNKPHLAKDLGDFWKRWHRSMAGFVMQYIYLPLVVTTAKTKLALVAAFVFMGLWHDLSIEFLIWGLGHGLGLALLLPWAREREFGPSTMRVASLAYVIAFSSIAHGVWSL